MWLTQLERLADPKYGLAVRFESGWKRRGASGGAQMRSVNGVLWHHDVSPRSGTYPLRNMLRTGRPGLSGPLCHIGFDRDGTVWVVGAGKANHAGTGSVPGVPRNAGNTRLVGVEMTSAGTRPWDWTAAQLREMPKLGAALSDIFTLRTNQHWGHMEYQRGKIDPAGLPGGMAGLRSRIGAVRFGGGTSAPSTPAPDSSRPWRTSPRVSGMSAAEVRTIQAEVDVTQDGKYGDQTGRAVRDLQKELGLTADGVWGPTTGAEVATIKAIVTENQKRIDRTLAVATENQKRIGQANEKLDWLTRVTEQTQVRVDRGNGQTAPIRRNGKEIGVRQEVADSKTLLMAQSGTLADIRQLLEDADVDTTVPDEG